MPKLAAKDIVDDVRLVLQGVFTGKGTERPFLTAYQIFNRLPQTVRDALVQTYGKGGKGGGSSFPATRLVSMALEKMKDVEIRYLDTKDLSLEVDGEVVKPGYRLCALFRLL